MKKGMHAIRNIYNKLHHGQFLQHYLQSTIKKKGLPWVQHDTVAASRQELPPAPVLLKMILVRQVITM
jgi:hypothetical protein